MFGGFDFAVPALLVSLGTVGVGGLVAALAWWMAASDGPARKSGRRFPLALYAFSASVLSDLLGMFVLSAMPDDWDQYHVLGARLPPAVYSLFLLISFTAVIVSVALLWGKQGILKVLLMGGSIVLIVINVLGIALFIMGLPGMPLH